MIHMHKWQKGGTDPSVRDPIGPDHLGRGGGGIPIESQGSRTPFQEGPH
jgi:hypothetical protein